MTQNIVWHPQGVTPEQRRALNGHGAAVIWFTGLSGAGKSTLANALEARLLAMGAHSYLLDGDNVRHGLNGDLGFSEVDRRENIRRIGEVSRLFADAGLIVLAAFISPYRQDREAVARLLPPGQFIEIHLDTPLSTCEQRDPKGLYRKARAGTLTQFTGIDAEYQAPEKPALRLNTAQMTVAECVEALIALLEQRAVLPAGRQTVRGSSEAAEPALSPKA
ncbi:adenylyl-sulfate kinase [Ferrimonas gelatinilytica]|uniref:Adenylyl-sulfate kinase n=1 Tax=Ferrimonas gelatinilytica TaxID=1255257 RepID=A0ABP9RSL7_9GAMM